jgi:hypothetical protein
MKTFLNFVEEKEEQSNSRLVIFDFDGTLFHSPEPETGTKIYERETGSPWPFKGWWGRVESLLPPIVPEKPDSSWYIDDVVQAQKESITSPDTVVVLMTGRTIKLKDRVMEILKHNGMNFHDTYFAGQAGTSGSGTFEIKANNIRNLMKRNYNLLEIWEDRPEHIEQFGILAKELKNKNPNLKSVIIHDVKRGTSKEF